MPELEMPTESQVTKAMVEYLISRRDALCTELASVEKQLARLGEPVKRPKIVHGVPVPIDNAVKK